MKKIPKPSCFSCKIDLSLHDKLKEDLSKMGFAFSKPSYTLFSAKKKGIICMFYESGKFTVQGKEKDHFIEFYLEPEIMKNFSYTHPEAFVNYTARIGVDEAGKGDFFGPLCVASVYADEEKIKELLALGVKDSKTFSDKKILEIGKKLKDRFAHTLLRIFPEKYNELYLRFKNLNSLLGWAHATVIEKLVLQTKCSNIIIDQFANESVVKKAVEKKKISIHLSQRHRAEEDIVVAAASILARYGFLEGMKVLSDEIDMLLPKGASKKVIETGEKIVSRHGPQILEKVAKIHFKTHGEIITLVNQGE